MTTSRWIVSRTIMFAMLFTASIHADQLSTGTDGINSRALGLTGDGIGIGMAEPSRPGDLQFDDDPSLLNAFVDATAVFRQDGPVQKNENIDDHSTEVAGVMISTDLGQQGITGGVSPMADLYASAIDSNMQQISAITLQHVAKQNGGDIRAINLSFAHTGGVTDGSATLSQFIDWSTRGHETLYVVAGATLPELGEPSFPIPADNYTGITVGYAEQINEVGQWRKVASRNSSSLLSGGRVGTDLIAPGANLFVDRLNNGTAKDSGTSFAAPHVTGTVALLQQHAESQIPSTGWDADARRHEVMKAVLMNSADKIEDDGMIAPVGTFLGMERTVLKKNGIDTWLNSTAFTDPNVPLDEQMGTGHLNANRAFTQFDAGESVPGDLSDQSANVPVIGWDYNAPNFDTFNKYLIQGNLLADTYISATLVWDRHLELLDDWDSDGEFDADDGTNGPDTFFEAAFSNLDLHVVPAGTTSLETATWKASSTAGQDESSVEHIFAEIQTTGQYEIWVENSHQFDTGGPYALAWWATTMLNPVLNGDYDDSAIVGQGDLDLVLTNWGDPVPPTPAGWINQVPTDGQVGQNELDAVLTNWGNTGGAGSLTAVPEPSGVLLLVVGLASIGWRSGTKPKQAPL